MTNQNLSTEYNIKAKLSLLSLLFDQKTKSCNAKLDGNKNGKKGPISKKQLAEHFFVHFFAVVLYEYNAKRPSYTFFIFVGFVPVRFFFSLLLIFTLLAASISRKKKKGFKRFLVTVQTD